MDNRLGLIYRQSLDPTEVGMSCLSSCHPTSTLPLRVSGVVTSEGWDPTKGFFFFRSVTRLRTGEWVRNPIKHDRSDPW